jgi:hypothetical protein
MHQETRRHRVGRRSAALVASDSRGWGASRAAILTRSANEPACIFCISFPRCAFTRTIAIARGWTDGAGVLGSSASHATSSAMTGTEQATKIRPLVTTHRCPRPEWRAPRGWSNRGTGDRERWDRSMVSSGCRSLVIGAQRRAGPGLMSLRRRSSGRRRHRPTGSPITRRAVVPGVKRRGAADPPQLGPAAARASRRRDTSRELGLTEVAPASESITLPFDSPAADIARCPSPRSCRSGRQAR